MSELNIIQSDNQLDKLNKELTNQFKKNKIDSERGVIYINRPPLFMKPQKVRFLMAEYGEVTNIFLQPEDRTIRKSRSVRGGTSKIKYKEGWVEFADKKIAESVADCLNKTFVGGNRRNFHYEDIWNIKYLPGFKWSYLREKTIHSKQSQKMRLRMELMHAKRENEDFIDKFSQGKKIKAIIKHKEKRYGKKDNILKERKQFKQLTLRKYNNEKNEIRSDDWLNKIMN